MSGDPLRAGLLDLSFQNRAAVSYLQAIPLADRRESGQVYTPPHLVDFIFELSGYPKPSPLEETVLDPACGAGAFLQAAVLRLASRLAADGQDPSSPRGHESLLGAVESRVFGVDIDAEACELARASVRDTVLRISPGPLPRDFFETNVVATDFLLGGSVDELPPLHAGGFAYVVGNPPYVPATRIDAAYKEALRSRYPTATGRLDLYTVFMERAVGVLHSGGRLAFITPNKYLTSQSAAPLRALLSRSGSVVSLASFRSHKVFENAATVPCVTVFEKGRTPGDVEVIECGERVTSEGKIPVLGRIALHAPRGRGPWHIGSAERLALAERVRGRHLPLAAFATRISAGIATGLDEVFVRPATELEVEPELVHPVARGRDLSSFRVADSGLAIVLPYRFVSGRAELVDLDDYPRTKSFLRRHEAALRSRHCVRVWNKAWWDVHDPVGWDLPRMRKILVPDVAASNRFAVDEGRVCPLHSAYYIVPKRHESEYLTGLLNSKPVEFLVRLLAPVVKDGFSRYRKQFLMQLPIPVGDEAMRARMMAAAAAADSEAVNALAAELYGLEAADLRVIESFLAERSAAHMARSSG